MYIQSCMANLKAMHSISAVMQTTINSYVWGVLDFSSSLKGAMHTAVKLNRFPH